MTFRKFLKAFLPLVVIGISTAIAYHMINTKAENTRPVLSEKVWQVDVVKAIHQTLSPSITLYGRVESPEQLQAAAPGAGVVEQVNIRNGDSVLKGDILLSLDRRDFESRRVQAESELKDLRSQISELKIRQTANLALLKTEQELLELAKADVARMRKLKNQNLGSDTNLSNALNSLGRQQLALQNRQLEVDSFATKLQMLKARQNQAKARLEDADLSIERSQIIAPFNARISSVPVSVGGRVAIGQTLISLYPLNSLEIRAHIPHSYVASIQSAMAGSSPVMARVKIGQQVFEFNLTRLAGEAEATGIDAYFSTADSGLKLRPGELLTLILSLPTEADVIAVPYQAVYGNDLIYLKRESRLVGIDVKPIGRLELDSDTGTTGSRLLIRSSAIKEGDLIVITHLPNAVSGLKVRTVDNDSNQ